VPFFGTLPVKQNGIGQFSRTRAQHKRLAQTNRPLPKLIVGC
jgi:hypothetical protein